MKEVARFVDKVTFKLVEFKTFSTLYIHHLVLYVKIWYTFEFICYIHLIKYI
jgi:hypothetical protein